MGGSIGSTASNYRDWFVSTADIRFASLMDFQSDTVEHVLDRFFGDEPTSRFLVADEVGMGKTLVAAGVISGVVERLEAPSSGVERIDILYICSNLSIAAQNLAKLNVRGAGATSLSTRISLLAHHVGELNRADPDGRKTVNLVAFTPGTSFQKGNRRGMVEERALLVHFTTRLFRGKARRNALRRILRRDVGLDRWKRELAPPEWTENPPDPLIGQKYRELLQESETLRKLRHLVDHSVGPGQLSAETSTGINLVIGEMRHLLARASVDALEPDLIILDEFQRFRQLLDSPTDGAEAEVSELARELFNAGGAKVLLLSATPYKFVTLPEERALTGDDHYKDLLKTVEFLAYPRGEEVAEQLGVALGGFRDQLISGGESREDRDAAEELLRSVMCRSERPVRGRANILSERLGEVDLPTEQDLVSYVRTKRLATDIDAQMSVDYWKSVPYFLNFMDGYQFSERLRRNMDDETVKSAVRKTPHVRRVDIRERRAIEPGNPRLRALQSELIGSGLHRMLWMPPSMPYHQGADHHVADKDVTKRLIFSSWAAAPSAIASLLSHEAIRDIVGTSSGRTSPRLTYAISSDNRPDRMSTLMVGVPQPGLAELCDPLSIARQHPDEMLTADEVVERAQEYVEREIPPANLGGSRGSSDSWYWFTTIRWNGHASQYSDLRKHFTGVEMDGASGLRRHLEMADRSVEDVPALGSRPADLARWVALVGLASPANCAWRALRRVTSEHAHFGDEAILEGAILIGEGFRSLFNREEVMRLVDGPKSSKDEVYWQRVLTYCLMHNLQAVLDEYLHHLIGNSSPKDDSDLVAIAKSLADTIAFGRGRVEALDPVGGESFRINTRFAVRYGSAKGKLASDDTSAERAGEIQAAFNSPFWPFVLASTSVGQEGIDFHWWCHSLIHWNQPANVVDLEQREGRVHRYKGHAVRKNVGDAHRGEALRSTHADPWAAAFEAAGRLRPDDMNDLWPGWVYPGEAKVTCWVPYMPLSKDKGREERLRRERAIYRLAFGQPRQEDLMAVLAARDMDPSEVEDLRINLRPPKRMK